LILVDYYSEEFDETSSDIVATEALRSSDVGSTAVVYDSTNSILKLLHVGLLGATSIDLVIAPGDGLLRGHAIPDTITGEEDELARLVNRDNLDVGEGSDSLVSGLHGGVTFVLKISNSAGESEGTVDTAIFDKSVSVVNSLALFGIIRLVILRHLKGDFTLSEDGTGVSSVGTDDFGRSNNASSSSASSVRLVVTTVKLDNLLLSSGGEHHLVHLVEDFDECLVILLSLESLKLYQLRHQMLLDIKCNFLTSMTVKNSEEADATSKIFLSDVGIFHGSSPSLHTDSNKA